MGSEGLEIEGTSLPPLLILREVSGALRLLARPSAPGFVDGFDDIENGFGKNEDDDFVGVVVVVANGIAGEGSIRAPGK